jgi:hypothetical protein
MNPNHNNNNPPLTLPPFNPILFQQLLHQQQTANYNRNLHYPPFLPPSAANFAQPNLDASQIFFPPPPLPPAGPAAAAIVTVAFPPPNLFVQQVIQANNQNYQNHEPINNAKNPPAIPQAVAPENEEEEEFGVFESVPNSIPNAENDKISTSAAEDFELEFGDFSSAPQLSVDKVSSSTNDGIVAVEAPQPAVSNNVDDLLNKAFDLAFNPAKANSPLISNTISNITTTKLVKKPVNNSANPAAAPAPAKGRDLPQDLDDLLSNLMEASQPSANAAPATNISLLPANDEDEFGDFTTISCTNIIPAASLSQPPSLESAEEEEEFGGFSAALPSNKIIPAVAVEAVLEGFAEFTSSSRPSSQFNPPGNAAQASVFDLYSANTDFDEEEEQHNNITTDKQQLTNSSPIAAQSRAPPAAAAAPESLQSNQFYYSLPANGHFNRLSCQLISLTKSHEIVEPLTINHCIQLLAAEERFVELVEAQGYAEETAGLAAAQAQYKQLLSQAAEDESCLPAAMQLGTKIKQIKAKTLNKQWTCSNNNKLLTYAQMIELLAQHLPNQLKQFQQQFSAPAFDLNQLTPLTAQQLDSNKTKANQTLISILGLSSEQQLHQDRSFIQHLASILNTLESTASAASLFPNMPLDLSAVKSTSELARVEKFFTELQSLLLLIKRFQLSAELFELSAALGMMIKIEAALAPLQPLIKQFLPQLQSYQTQHHHLIQLKPSAMQLCCGACLTAIPKQPIESAQLSSALTSVLIRSSSSPFTYYHNHCANFVSHCEAQNKE